MKDLFFKTIPSVRTEEQALFDLCSDHGRNSNSFLTLYEGYSTFVGPQGIDSGAIRYIAGKYAWIAATEPLASRAATPELLEAFAAAARASGKVAMMLPVNADFLPIAEKLGYSAIAIGSEPLFLFDEYVPAIDTVSGAKRLAAKGARVQELPADSVQKRADLNALVAAWLSSRKMAELGFLNRVRPWWLGAHKKYFSVEWGGRVLAFVAAVPVPASRGWYLVDTFRSPSAPPGSTELLMLETMRLLKEQGAKWVSLGVSPLSNLDRAVRGEHYQLETALRTLYTHGKFFYSFDSLYRYKLKFKPNRIEPTYLLVHPRKISVANAMGILEAFVGGPKKAALANLKFHWENFSLRGRLFHDLRTDVAWAAPAKNATEIAKRCSLSIALSAMGVAFMAVNFPYAFAFALLSFVALSAASFEYVMGTKRVAGVLLATLAIAKITHPYLSALSKIPYAIAWPWRWMLLGGMAYIGGIIGSLKKGANLIAFLSMFCVLCSWFAISSAGWVCLMGLNLGFGWQFFSFRKPRFLISQPGSEPIRIKPLN